MNDLKSDILFAEVIFERLSRTVENPDMFSLVAALSHADADQGLGWSGVRLLTPAAQIKECAD